MALPHLGLGPLGIPGIAMVGGILVMVLGAIDDVRGLDFKTKLVVEVFVAYMLLHAGLRINLSVLPFVGEDVFLHALYSIPLTILWVVGVMNAVNLVDGIDGLASGVVAIAFASMALAYGLAGDLPLVFVALVFVGALAGFLVHNFNPASIFMGDSGSLFLGYALAVYTLSGPIREEAILTPALPLLALGLPLLDTSLSMVRRVSSRRAMMAPDHDHIHHRMSRAMSTRKAVAVLYAISAMFGLLAVLADSTTGMGVLIALGCAAAVATGLLIRLGYVRLPYAAPALKPVAFPPTVGSNTPDVNVDSDAPAPAQSDAGPPRPSPLARRPAPPASPPRSSRAIP
ncbi:MraY family glycosyltransferase [Rubrivirga sp.]|uniref:MraY family glycosyltransferase n=1 Tax=Rubrivirga sp. TaxID=1885344 RepID=UPI003C782341